MPDLASQSQNGHLTLDASHRHAPSPHSSSKLEFWKIIKAPCVYLQRCKLLGCNVPAQRWLVPFLHLQPWFTLAMTPVPTLSSQPMFPYLSYPISHSPRTTRQNVRYAGFLAGGSWSTAAHTHPSTLGRTGTWLFPGIVHRRWHDGVDVASSF